jgi:lipoprotein-anchoring transpeptidase ErfK/SrfK
MSNKVFTLITLLELAVLGGVLWWWQAGRSEGAPSQSAPPAQSRAEKTELPTPQEAVTMTETPPPPKASATPPTPPARTEPPPAELPRGPLGQLVNPAILIDKSSRLLAVYDNGQLVKVYPAAVGGQAGDKQKEGDRRTPEGEFFVCVKNNASKYTRALGLSYPTEEDAHRGLQAGLITRREHSRILAELRAGRRPPWNTALGGEIMIHGDRRGGRDTLGCIALEDDDIIELFPKIPLGTRVVIRP